MEEGIYDLNETMLKLIEHIKALAIEVEDLHNTVNDINHHLNDRNRK